MKIVEIHHNLHASYGGGFYVKFITFAITLKPKVMDVLLVRGMTPAHGAATDASTSPGG